MERSKNITNITSILLLSFGLLASTTLLAVALFASPAEAKPASVLLQEGLYAEEIEGDLEAAIKIYKQVIAEVKAAQQTAAQATYRLGMCYLKKGQEEKAAEYFQQVVSNYSAQKVVVEKANKQFEKIRPIDDIISRSYVIHYKAVDQSKDALELLNRNHPKGVKTHHANRYRKSGTTIASICTDTREGKEKIVTVIEGSDELKLVKVVPPMGQTKESIFEQIDYQVIRFLGEQFGETALEAGQQHLSVNSHIYYVDRDGSRYQGGMNAFYNWTGRTITQKVRFGGTSYPNQTHYGVDGHELKTEIVPDKTRPNHWQIYWIPDEPLAPEEHLYYGWSMNNKRKLSKLPGGVYSLIMQNKYGSPVIETFFLVLPKDLKILKSNSLTGSEELLNFDVYWWTKTVQQGENHVVTLSLQKVPQHTQQMHNEIDPNGLIHFKSPHNYTNVGTEPMTNTSFINSDFVNVVAMYYKNGQPVKYTTTHEGNHFRYNITFDKPILQGETIEATVEGTITGLIKPVASMPDTYQYYMNHSPSTNMPTLRTETYLLPKGAEVISTSLGMKKSEKNGRIELTVEKIIPVGGSLLTTFQYTLSGAKLASAEPLKLEPAPWVDGEVMEVRLKRPAGGEHGTIIYSAQSNTLDDNNTWQIISHMYVTEGSISQYTFVEAEAESSAPIYGQTTNWMGNFVAEYNEGNVKLTVDTEGKESTRDVPVQGIAYDNEQALYLIRRMPLAENYEGSFPIFSVQGGVTIECRIEVLGTEDIAVEAGTFTCYKTDLSIYAAEVKTLQHTLWFSADEHKYLVKYDVGGAATMELTKVWQKDKDRPLTFENEEPHFSVTMPADWRFYSYASAGPQFSLQLIPPEVKAWSVLVWQKRGTDPDSASAMTIAKADCEKLKGFFENYTMDETSWKEYKINGLEAAQYFATYQKKGSPLRKYTKPKQMVEYRTYIVDESNVYWFVFRIDKDKFKNARAELDSIIQSFERVE